MREIAELLIRLYNFGSLNYGVDEKEKIELVNATHKLGFDVEFNGDEAVLLETVMDICHEDVLIPGAAVRFNEIDKAVPVEPLVNCERPAWAYTPDPYRVDIDYGDSNASR